jgi:hypothetical protein
LAKKERAVQKHKDPAEFKLVVAKTKPSGKKILCLGADLGTTTGYAYAWIPPGELYDPSKHETHLGLWDCSAGQFDSGAIRFLRLRYFLSMVSPELVFFEHVRFTPPSEMMRLGVAAVLARSATSTEFFGAMMGTATAWCEEHGVAQASVPIKTIKLRATGKGNANKEAVIKAAGERLGLNFDVTEPGLDNACDAFWALTVGVEEIRPGLKPVEHVDVVEPIRIEHKGKKTRKLVPLESEDDE